MNEKGNSKGNTHFQYLGSIYTVCRVRCTGRDRDIVTTEDRKKVTCHRCGELLDRVGKE